MGKFINIIFTMLFAATFFWLFSSGKILSLQTQLPGQIQSTASLSRVSTIPAAVPSTPPMIFVPATQEPKPVLQAELSPPLTNALQRVTKKTFGLYVSPGHSPVSPERFTGYHSGVDFETLPDEQAIDVLVSALCSGPLVMKKIATGYGGVAVQQCKLGGQDVTIIYGHLRYSSIKPAVHEQLTSGEQFAVLGTGYSKETDGERKHLHLGIHKGTSISILGYVQNKADLSQWLDATKYL